MRTKYNTLEYIGKRFDLYVTDTGHFYAYPEGANTDKVDSIVGAATHDDLVKRLKQKARERRVEAKIPFTELSGGTLRDGVARGISSKNYRHEILVTWADGTKDQISSYHDQLQRLEGGERTRIAHAAKVAVEAQQTADRAKTWLDHLTKPYRVNLRDAIERHKTRTAEKELAAEAAEG